MNYAFSFGPVFASWRHLLAGLEVTLELSVGAMVVGLAISVLLAWGKTFGPRAVRIAIDVYVEVIRNTPFIVQIFFIFFGLPTLGIRLTPDVAALVAMVVNVAAYATEIIRAGIESVQKGQIEAGLALALNRGQVFRHVVIRPALRTIYPALTSQFIYLMLTSSVVSVIAANDLTAAGNDIQSRTFAAFEVYLVITVIYFLLSAAFSAVFSVIGRLAFAWPTGR